MSTCNRLDLQTLGSHWLMMSKRLPDHNPHLHMNSSSLGTNEMILDQNYKYTS